MDSAVAALLGAAIGMLGSVGGVWLQQRHQSKRDRLKIAADLGLADFNRTLERIQAPGEGGPLPPVALFIAYHADVLDAMAAGKFGPDEVERIERRQSELLAAMPRRYKQEGAARATQSEMTS